MTRSDIAKWCDDHVFMKRKYEDISDNGTHYVEFENGDSYKLIQKGKTLSDHVTETYINGKLVNVSSWHYTNFHYDLVSETTF